MSFETDSKAKLGSLYEVVNTFAQLAVYPVHQRFVPNNIFNINHNQRGEACWCDALFVAGRTAHT